MSQPAAPARWTRARIIATAVHSAVGLLIGALLTPELLGAGFLFSRGALGKGAYLLAAGAGIFVVARAARASCKKHPAAPAGIAWGLGAGAFVVLLIVGANIWRGNLAASGWPMLCLLAQAVGQPWAAFVWAKR